MVNKITDVVDEINSRHERESERIEERDDLGGAKGV